MARNKKQPDHRADTRGGNWVGIPAAVLDSAAYQHLTDRATRVLSLILRRFNGYNNGSIAISVREFAQALRIQNYSSISKAVAELMEHGFVDVAAEGQWKERMAREYRVTFISYGKPGNFRSATNDYLHWEPKKKLGAERVSAELTPSDERASAKPRKFDEAVSARIARKRQKAVDAANFPAEAVSSLISKPYPGGEAVTDAEPIDPPEQPLNSAGAHSASEMVRRHLGNIRMRKGLLGLGDIANSAGVQRDRLVAFVEGRDLLETPSISRIKRTLKEPRWA